MKRWRTIGAASAIALLAMLSTASSADDGRAALEKDIAALNQQIEGKQQQITALRNKPSPEQADVVAAQRALEAARAEQKATPGPDADGKVRNSEFKLKLAQLKFDKSNGGIETLQDDIDKLKQQVAAKQQQIKGLGAQSAEQPPAPQQKPADDRQKRQQQEELAKAKQETESAQKEIERLKAALAAKEAAQAKVAPATPVETIAPKPAEAPKAAETKPVETKSTETQSVGTKAAEAKPVENTAKVTAPTPPEPAKTAAPAASSGSGLIKLSSQDQVLHELQSTAQLVSQAGKGESEASLVMYLKHPGMQTTNKDKISLRALGNGQYRGSSKVEPGDYEAVIGFNHWPVQFAASESGELTFLCDYRNSSAPRLVVYEKSLEGAAK